MERKQTQSEWFSVTGLLPLNLQVQEDLEGLDYPEDPEKMEIQTNWIKTDIGPADTREINLKLLH